MARKYRYMSSHETEITERWNNGKALIEIGDAFGFTLKEINDFKETKTK